MTVVPSRAAGRLVLVALAALLLLVSPAAPAWAHNALKSSTPAADATLTSAPTEVTLEFMQALNPQFTTVTVTGPDQQEIGAAPRVEAARASVALDAPRLNGVYTVAYRVVSSDGHPVQGSYTFTLEVPGGPSAPAAVEPAGTSPEAELTAEQPGVGVATIVAILIAGLLLVSAAVFFWVRSRRAR